MGQMFPLNTISIISCNYLSSASLYGWTDEWMDRQTDSDTAHIQQSAGCGPKIGLANLAKGQTFL